MWIVYAGIKRRYLADFEASNRVFLSLPGFDAVEDTFSSAINIRRHLAMSDQVSKWLNKTRDTPPSRNAQSYKPYPYEAGSIDARSFSAELGNINRLFVEAQVGDVVLSPGDGQYEPFLIGEISKKWSRDDNYQVERLDNEAVPARRVRWLNLALARRDFNPRTAKKLVNRHAITELGREYYSDVFDTIYENYIWQDRSKIDLFGDEYKGKDPLQPYDSAKLLKYVMASAFAFSDDQFDDFQSLSIDDAIEKYYDETLVEDIYQNFNSPGKFTVITRKQFVSALIAAGLLLSTSACSDDFHAQKQEISQQVTGSMKGSGKAVAAAKVDDFLESCKPDVWQPVQKGLGEKAKKHLGLSLSNAREVAQHRSQLSAK